jgi:hypothetical protein
LLYVAGNRSDHLGLERLTEHAQTQGEIPGIRGATERDPGGISRQSRLTGFWRVVLIGLPAMPLFSPWCKHPCGRLRCLRMTQGKDARAFEEPYCAASNSLC